MASYLPQVKTKVNMIKYISDANVLIHTRVYTYEKLHDEIGILIKYVKENKGDHDHDFCGVSSAKNISRLITTFLMITNLRKLFIKLSLS